MLRSMTGYASATLALTNDDIKTTLTITLKSLNSRFFELTCKMPYQLNSLEVDIAKFLKDQLHRGHTYLTIYASNEDFFQGSVEPSMQMLTGYMEAIERIKQQFRIEGSLTVHDIISIPDLFSIEQKNITDATKKEIFTVIQNLAQELITAEEKEGVALKKDLEQRIKTMEQNMQAIEQASTTLIERQKEKVAKALQAVPLNENNLVDMQKHAAYVLLEKMDINEEIVRFNTHMKSSSAIINAPFIEKGKRIDFTLQEMAREINTIAAKCSDAVISSLAINIKVELEKMREQIQNIV